MDAAKRLHAQLNLRERVISSEQGYVDVFSVIEELGIDFMFQPLDKALGFCLAAPARGIVVTTERSLQIQRYTAAHELGHAIMEHEGSIDGEEILFRGGARPGHKAALQEVAAEAFAAEFLLPRWLYLYHLKKQGWMAASYLNNPEIVYQISLRLNASYQATCWGLLNNEFLKKVHIDRLLAMKPKDIKADTINPVKEKVGHSDTWRFRFQDNGGRFYAKKGDLFRLDLDESNGGGYLWDLSTLERDDMLLLNDSYPEVSEERYGGSKLRKIILRDVANSTTSEHDILLSEKRPWEPPSFNDNAFGLSVDVSGAESQGLSRAARRNMGL